MALSFSVPTALAGIVKQNHPPQLRLTGPDRVVHYAVVLFCGLIILGLLYLEYISPFVDFSLPFFAIPAMFLLTFFLLYRRNRKLDFLPVAMHRSVSDAFTTVLEATESAGWKVVDAEQNSYLRLWTIPAEKGTTNYGELVTILFGEGVVYINSINDPGNRLHLYSGSANKGHAAWIETVLEKGVWKYDPEERRNREPVSPPRAAAILNNVIDGDPPRYAKRIPWEYIQGVLAATLVGWFENLETLLYSDASNLPLYSMVGIPLTFILIRSILYRRYGRFGTIPHSHDGETAYRLVHSALTERHWHINYDDGEKGIEARFPNTTPEDGELAVILFRDNAVYVNVFNGAGSTSLSFNSSRRLEVSFLVDQTLNSTSSIRHERSDILWPLLRKTVPPPAETSLSAFIISGKHVRLRLYGSRRKAFYNIPWSIISFCLLMGGVSLPFALEQDINVFMSSALPTVGVLLAGGGSIALLTAVIITERLHVQSVDLDTESSALYEPLLELLPSWKWKINRTIPALLIEAYREDESPYSEMITILFADHRVYINSINKLEGHRPGRYGWEPARYSMKRNRENVARVTVAIRKLQERIKDQLGRSEEYPVPRDKSRESG